jgi:hypothetical protein
MAAQKKTGSVITILPVLLNPRDARKSQDEITQTFCGGRRLGCLRLDSSQAKCLASTADLHCDGRLDRWVRVVADKLEIFEFEIVHVFYGGIQFHPW